MEVLDLDDDQRQCFKEFSEAIKDCSLPDSSDTYKLKWLRARNYDAAEAESMLRKSLEWRKLYKIDSILEIWSPPEVLVKYFPVGCSGKDKYGCPVIIHAAGRADLRGIWSSITASEYMRFQIYNAEKFAKEMAEYSLKYGKKVTQQCMIVDMEFLTMKQLTHKKAMEAGKELTALLEANYPESLRKIFIVNAPKLFTFLYAVIKPMIHPLTLEKFEIFGNNTDEWKAALLNDIDIDQLPVHYGGILADTDGNPMYLSKICMGGEVPSSYYLSKSPCKPREGMKFITVSRGAKTKLEFNELAVGSMIKWEFITKQDDIGFYIYRIDRTTNKQIMVVPWSRINASTVIEEGFIGCSHQSTYFVVFDNSYSYFRSKSIWYMIATE